MPATVTPGASPFDGAADTRIPMRPLPTPLVLIAVTPLPSPPTAAALPSAATAVAEPDLVSVFAPSSGHTRIDPIERRVQKRAPLGMPLPLAAPLAPVLAPPETGRQSKLWVVMLLVAAPLLVLAAIIGTKPFCASATRSAAEAPAALAVAPSEATPVVAPRLPVLPSARLSTGALPGAPPPRHGPPGVRRALGRRCGRPPRRERAKAAGPAAACAAAQSVACPEAASPGRRQSLKRKTTVPVASIWSRRPHHV